MERVRQTCDQNYNQNRTEFKLLLYDIRASQQQMVINLGGILWSYSVGQMGTQGWIR